ncbi:MAG: LamG-like jellyroll fold domain-containing protein [Pirellulaceae bacterium]
MTLLWDRWLSIVIAVAAMFPTLGMASGATLDRNYRLGEDSFENGSANSPAGANIAGTLYTVDSEGALSAHDLADLEVFGNPTYANVSDRPLFTSGVGISFDGSGDYLVGQNLNNPATSYSSINYDDTPNGGAHVPGPIDYTGMNDRFFQFWAKPNSAGQNATQSVVMDSNQHGVRIVDGKWSMRYGGQDVVSETSVAFGQWSHIMLARPSADVGSVLFVDGVAVAGLAGGYDGAAHEELVVGSTTARDVDDSPLVGQGEFYNGLLDDLTMSVVGFNSVNDFGEFSLLTDSRYVAGVSMVGVPAADVNLDKVVNAADVTAFVDGWLSATVVNGVQIGDINSRSRGDLNFDGITDLADWGILHSANPQIAAAAGQAIFGVPEPTSLSLGIVGLLIVSMFRVRERN